jgi:hypothetical protein
VNAEGIAADPDLKLTAVASMTVPTSVKELQTFIGLCAYYHRFVKNFSEIARPLRSLTKKGAKYVWTCEQQQAFDQLKYTFTHAPGLGHPRYNLPMKIHADASQDGLRAVLVQVVSKKFCVMPAGCYRQVNGIIKIQKKSVCDDMGCTKVQAIRLGGRIRIVTDHHALCWLMKKRNLSGRLARWSLALQKYDI